MTFSTAHIAVTALIVAVISVPVAAAMLRRNADGVVLAVLAALTTFGWRLVANVDALNTDGIAWVSANDVLAGVIAYIVLGMYAALRPPTNPNRYEQLRVGIAAVAVAVNIIAI